MSDTKIIKDGIRDVLHHTHSLGFCQMIRFTAGENEKLGKTCTTAFTKEPNSNVIINATLNNHWGVECDFGIGDLRLLNWVIGAEHLNDEGSTLDILTDTNKEGETYPSELMFTGSDGSNQSHRFVHSTLLERHLKTFRLKKMNWNVEFTPSQAEIKRFIDTASAIKEYENSVVFKTVDGKLHADLGGDSGNHRADLVFCDKVEGTLDPKYRWSVNFIESILKLTNNAAAYNMKIMTNAPDAAIMITIDSGLATYEYAITPLA